MKRTPLIVLVIILIIIAGIFLFYNLTGEIDEEKPVKVTLPWDGELVDASWLNDEELILIIARGDMSSEVELRVFLYEPFTENSNQIHQTQGWRLHINILDVAPDGDLFALNEGDNIVLMDSEGEIVHFINEAGSNAQASFSPDGEVMAYTTLAEWELPTNAVLLNLKDFSKESLTDYEFGQNYKTGKIGWTQNGEFYYVEEYAYGTVTFGGQKIFHISEEGEKSLFWETLMDDQVIAFEVIDDNKLFNIFVCWDDEAMETQLSIGKFDIQTEEEIWSRSLDRMGDRDLWFEENREYPTDIEKFDGVFWGTAIDGDGRFSLIELDIGTGEILTEESNRGFPRISPGKEWLLYRDLSGETTELKIRPLTNPDDLG